MVRRTPAASQADDSGLCDGPIDIETDIAIEASAPEAAAPPRPWRRFLLVLIVIAAVVALVFGLHLQHWVSLRELSARRAAMQAFVRTHPVLSLELYAGGYAALVALSLPGALLMSLGGGYFFGVATGAAAAVGGMTVGALVMYALARTALGDLLTGLVRRRGGAALARRMRGAVEHDGFFALLTLRLIPGVPFALVNVLAGVVRLPLASYLVATVLGVTPSTLVYAWIGQGLGRVFRPGGAPDLRRLIGPEIYAPLLLLALLAAGPLLYVVRRRWSGSPRGALE